MTLTHIKPVTVAVVAALSCGPGGSVLEGRPGAGQQPSPPTQTAALKIVVIEGEAAVNIIQQRTAVRPVVEVRDRNDLPVSGVPVTFAILGKNASFGGAQTLTVVTNAAGRAAVTTLTPVASGPLQISATATVAGQTATATITQTNFVTAAAAAQAGATPGAAGAGGTGAGAGAGAGAAAGAAAGGGGGLSGLAIAGIVVGAGAGAVIGAKAAGVLGGGDKGEACTFSVSPTSLSFPSSGGSASITVMFTPSDCEFSTRSWTATSNAPFITVNPAGETTASVFVAINESGNPPRTGTVTVAGQTVTVTQTARCAFSVSPTSLTFPASGGTQILTVTVRPDPCDDPTWRASSGPQAFVILEPASGSGNGTVAVTLPRNPFTGRMTGVISINSILIQWIQDGQPTTLCAAQRVQGGDMPTTRTIELGKTSGRLRFQYDNGANSADRMLIIYEGRTLFDTGCAGTAGARTEYVTYSGRSSALTVQVIPNCRGGSGSTWAFEIGCGQ